MERTPTILVVDDLESGREVLRGVLETEGYNVFTAENGAEALAKAAAVRPDLVLLDVMMPEMDGFEVCRRMRADSQLALVPIIIVTALDDRASKLQAIEVGADEMLSKPFDRAEIRLRVRTITRLNRFRRLHAERAKFEWALEHSEDGYLVLGAKDEITYSNPKARHFLGLPNGERDPISQSFEAVARRHYQFNPGRSETGIAVDTLPWAPPTGFLVKPATDQHEAMWLRYERIPIDDGGTEGILVRLHDVTSRVLLQRDCWTFNALVRHKLCTPLTSVGGAIAIIEEAYSEKVDPEVKDLLAMAARGAKKLRDDIEGIFKHLQAVGSNGSLGTDCRVADLRGVAATLAREMKLNLTAVSFIGVDESAPQRLALSRESIELILNALLENSKKFHPTRSPGVSIRIVGEKDFVRVEVTDDGVSLSPEQLEQVWVPYYQAERYFTGQVPGMGLGLPTVATLVSRIGGACRIQNRRDADGIVVDFTSPIARVREGDGAPALA